MKPLLISALILVAAASLVLGGCGSSSSTGGSGGSNTPAPTISSISPKSASAGASSLTLTVSGSGFLSTSVVQVGGNAETTSYVSGAQLTAIVPASQLASGALLTVVVANGSVNSGSATPTSLEIDNPTPTILAVSPNAEAVGATAPVVTVTGMGFVPTTVINVNGGARTTTFVSATKVSATLTAADVAASGTLSLTAVNSTPGGGTSAAANVAVSAPTPTPVITSVTPNSIIEGSADTYIEVIGTGFTANSVVQWNGTALATGYSYWGDALVATVPAADLANVGSASVTVNTPTALSLSNAVTVNITNPPAPTLTSINPGAGPANTATPVTLTGTGFTELTTASVNGQSVSCTEVEPTQLTCQFPAYSVASLGNLSVTVTTPAPGGGTSAPLSYTTYLAIPNNDIVFNPNDGLLYASVPVTGIGSGGNSVAGIDPVTGTTVRQIWVGSNPNKLALSTDGTQLFVGLDGAAAVAQVDLTKGAVVNQFSLGGGPGPYNAPYTASYLAAVPGSPNSVAVVASGTGVTIFDSGVPRAKSSSAYYVGPLSFGSSSSTLYMLGGETVYQLTVDSTGVSSTVALSTLNYYATSIQYDSGRLYVGNGQVLDASTGALLGTLYSSANTAATGPVVSDSALGRAFVAYTNFSSNGQVLAFDENTFNSLGNVPVNDTYPSFQKIVRWGQNGVAISANLNTSPSSNQIFIFQLPLVKDLSASPADLSVTLSAPATASTGGNSSWIATIKNNGPDQAQGAMVTMNLDSSLIINSIIPSQGSCGSGPEFNCDLGNIANGASATVTVNATPSIAGTFAGVAAISSTSYDPTTTNNQATTSTIVSGGLYGAPPTVSSISPNLVQAGSAAFTLTVNGAGFNSQTVVNLGTTALPTTYVSAAQLTATVAASEIANYGWAGVSVTNAAPGGGVSQVVPLTVYAVVNVPASGLLFEPYSRMLYATVPSTATSLTGNSVVAIDPITGTVGTPVFVGSGPNVMAETGDGNYLYVGLSGADSLAQFNLLTQSLTATIPLAITQYGTTSSVAATWIAAMPGSDSTLAVSATNVWGNFGIFDVSGNTGAFRPNLSGIYSGVDPVFADASDVYAYTGAEFYRYSVNSNGLTLIDGTTLDGISGSGAIQLANGLVYGTGGGIINPSTTPPSQVATLPFFDFYLSGFLGSGAGVVADPSLQKEFVMMENTAGTWAYGLARYDLTTYKPEALIDMPTTTSSVESNWTMLRCGQDGLALLSSGENYSTDQPETVLMLVRGPFVTPQLLTTNSAATLVASSSNSITHGSGNALLTLTGSNLLPGVAVTWNGSYRTTTRVNSTRLTVAIPASDLASSGTGSLVATNPGASASNALQITIQ